MSSYYIDVHRNAPQDVGERTLRLCQAQREASLPGAEVSQEAEDLVNSVILAYTVMRPMTKSKEVLLVSDVLFAGRAEPVRVKDRWVAEPLQQASHHVIYCPHH